MKIRLPFAVAGLALGMVVGVAVALNTTSKPGADATCQGKAGQSYNVMIMDSKASPDHIAGKLCDTVTFTNHDSVAREIAFGPHEDHVPYDGVAEKVLNRGQSFTITLNQTGSFHWHDHLHDEVEGFFTVSK